MAVVGRTGSGPKGQTETLSPWEEKEEGRMKRWAGGEHVEEQAGEGGTAVKGPSQSDSSEPGGSLQHNGKREGTPLSSLFTPPWWPSGSPSQGLECKSKY